MALLNWSASYSVGVAVLDAEHKEFFDLLNGLYDSILDGSASDGTTGATIDKVFDFAINHCNHEEELLAQAKYPGLASTASQHDVLRQAIEDHRRRYRERSCSSIDIANFLMEWALQHILKEDKKCGAFLNAAGIR